MNGRIVIGGTDVTDHIARHIADAPLPNPQQAALLRHIFGTAPAATPDRRTAPRRAA